MASKEHKAIKQLKKQLKKLNARIEKMHKEIKDLQAAADTNVSGQMAENEWSGSKFSAVEVETANELTDDAEEVADILEKKTNKQ